MNILSMSGFIPEQICDTVRFTHYPGERNIAAFCGYASDFLSQAINDSSIDGAVFPKSCDSCRTMASYLEESGKFFFRLHVPARTDAAAVDYFAEEIRRYQSAVENHYHAALRDIRERTETVNRRNAAIRERYDSLAAVDYFDYLSDIHENLRRPLYRQKLRTALKAGHKNGKRVFLVGSFLADPEVARLIEGAGLKIVGDDLPESGRLCSVPETETEGDLYRNIAGNILRCRPSPTQNRFAGMLDPDLEEIKRKKVQGVIMVMQKYCEPYEYLYSVYRQRLEAEKIPVLKLSLLHSEDSRKVALQAEAFADML